MDEGGDVAALVEEVAADDAVDGGPAGGGGMGEEEVPVEPAEGDGKAVEGGVAGEPGFDGGVEVGRGDVGAAAGGEEGGQAEAAAELNEAAAFKKAVGLGGKVIGETPGGRPKEGVVGNGIDIAGGLFRAGIKERINIGGGFHGQTVNFHALLGMDGVTLHFQTYLASA